MSERSVTYTFSHGRYDTSTANGLDEARDVAKHLKDRGTKVHLIIRKETTIDRKVDDPSTTLERLCEPWELPLPKIEESHRVEPSSIEVLPIATKDDGCWLIADRQYFYRGALHSNLKHSDGKSPVLGEGEVIARYLQQHRTITGTSSNWIVAIFRPAN